MPPHLAALLTYALVAWLFVRDIRQRPNITGALWLPVMWFLFLATRHPSQWLTVWGVPGFGTTSLEEGSNLDAMVYLALIAAGACVLTKRGVRLSALPAENRWVAIFLGFCLISVLWAEYPVVALKRWIKILGHPLMALVILTEPDPKESIKRFVLRSTYVLVPISIMLIKYFPAIGRRGGGWATLLQNVGITTGKNMFGQNCWVIGLFLVWYLLQAWSKHEGAERTKELRLLLLLLAMNLWATWQAQSAASWAVFMVGTATILFLQKPGIRYRRVGLYAFVAVAVIGTLEVGFDASAQINAWRGKVDTIAGRGALWSVLLKMGTNPVIGTGFENFWIGERLQAIWAMPQFSFWKPNEAHNGYLEIYLSLGVVGLVLLIGMIRDVFRKTLRTLAMDREFGRFCIGSLFAILAYNWVEVGFRGLSVVFFLFFLVAVSYGPRVGARAGGGSRLPGVAS